MKTRRVLLVLTGGLVLAVGALAAACGGGDGGGDGDGEELTLEEYFDELEALFADGDERAEELDDQIAGDLDDAEDDEQEADAYRQFIDDVVGFNEDLLEDLDRLGPPEEVADEHEAFVENVEGFGELFRDIAEDAEDADSGRDVEELLDEHDLVADTLFDDGGFQAVVQGDLTFVCGELQDIADEEEIDVDLGCDEGGGDGGDGDADADATATEELDGTDGFDGTDGVDGASALEDYFFELEPLVSQFTTDITTLSDQFLREASATTSEQEVIDLAVDFYDQTFFLATDLADAVAALDAPIDVVLEHDELLAATDALAARLDELSTAALGGNLEGDFIAAGTRFDDACFALQSAADVEAIFADLQCEG
ncbi:MAG: hypothetical protein U1B78_03820 [Dehalococcoidia bacterium]|nr:hypothetical protein [Dehalococcoidia bacterium]